MLKESLVSKVLQVPKVRLVLKEKLAPKVRQELKV